MRFMLTVSDVSLWLAVTAIVLLITSEVLYSSPEFASYLGVERKRLRLVALGCGLGFLVTVVTRVFQPF
jgi:hypothetical protein